jgi:hypothetical protein
MVPGEPTADEAAGAGQSWAAQSGLPTAVAFVELTGVEAGSLGQLAMLPGVLAVWPVLDPDADPRTRLDLVRVTVSEPASDGVLRRLRGPASGSGRGLRSRSLNRVKDRKTLDRGPRLVRDCGYACAS